MQRIRPCHTGYQTRFTNWPAPASQPIRRALPAPSASRLIPKFESVAPQEVREEVGQLIRAYCHSTPSTYMGEVVAPATGPVGPACRWRRVVINVGSDSLVSRRDRNGVRNGDRGGRGGETARETRGMRGIPGMRGAIYSKIHYFPLMRDLEGDEPRMDANGCR